MKIHILNTVCMPIKTGPAFTGVIRAKYWQTLGYEVILIYPFLSIEGDQLEIYKKQYTQNEFIRYLRDVYAIPDIIQIVLCKTKYNDFFNCQLSSISDFGNEYKEDILFIEDPEPLVLSNPIILHRLCMNYKFVVLILHTQYKNISKRYLNNPIYTLGIDLLDTFVGGSIYFYSNLFSISICKAIRNQYDIRFNINNHIVSSKVHGVKDTFFDIRNNIVNTNQIYYIGKLDRIHKGFDYMLKCAKHAEITISVFGLGKDLEFIQSNSDRFSYKGLVSSPEQLDEYSVYVSFSNLEGICTATAEAIVMNKICIIRKCDCNDMFSKFNNVFFFKDEEEFKSLIEHVRTIQYIIPGDVSAFKWDNCNAELRRICSRMNVIP
jgi:glycosyltransferase involved in cell wall biosynthesis